MQFVLYLVDSFILTDVKSFIVNTRIISSCSNLASNFICYLSKTPDVTPGLLCNLFK